MTDFLVHSKYLRITLYYIHIVFRSIVLPNYGKFDNRYVKS